MFRLVVTWVAAVVMIAATFSCSTTKVAQTDTQKSNEKEVYYNIQIIRDSVVKHDSVFQLVKGDSVIIERWHNVYHPVYVTNTVTDTICKTDTITQYQTITKTATPSETYLERLIKAIVMAGFVFVIALLIYNVIRYITNK